MDVIAASAYALLLATHSRISELHRLDAYDCEVETVENGERRYGLRWYPSKGGEPETRWVPTALVPLASEALQRLREATETGAGARPQVRRRRANPAPGRPPRSLTPATATSAWQTLADRDTDPKRFAGCIAQKRNRYPMGVTRHGSAFPSPTAAKLYLRAPIEEGFRTELPEGFPLADAKSRLRLPTRALLVRTAEHEPPIQQHVLAPRSHPVRLTIEDWP